MKRTFHIIFKTHLDIGFTALGRDVEKLYLESFVPGSIDLAERMKDDPSGADFKWTVGSWLIHKCLDNYKGKELRRFENAIADGLISWHALPFTVHSEFLTPSLFEYGLSLSWELDRRFGRRTRAAKMTDVPGHTRGIVPLLASAGIDFLHLGSNPGSTPPDVPELFIWENPRAGAHITVMYQKGGYGNIFAAPKLKTGLNVTFTCDNLGPPNRDEILKAFDNVREKFPDATVRASSFDAFATALAKENPSLPIIRGEMGDTWIHGVGTAPGKVRKFRALTRRRDQWLEAGVDRKYIKKFNSFSENLLLIGEHTWGLDVKTHLADEENFLPSELKKARKKKNFKLMEESWREQESYIDKAVEALKGTPYFKKANEALEACETRFPKLSDYKPIKPADCVLENDVFKISFDPKTGAALELRDKEKKKNYASAKNQLGLMIYETFGSDDVARFLKQYGYNNPEDWFRHDFGKPGLEKKLKKGVRRNFSLQKTLYRSSGGTTEAVMVFSPDKDAKGFGCPEKTFVTWRINEGSRTIEIDVAWKEKPASRVPEAVWMGFSPTGAASGAWELNKLGQWISPLRALDNGNKKLHAVGTTGVVLIKGENLLTIRTKDAPLVAPGEPSIYDFNNRKPPLSKGMFFNLFNNAWGTNFPQYSDEDGFFRFQLVFGDL